MDNEKGESEKENNPFKNVKDGLKNSIESIKQTLDNINDWDELMNLKEESIEYSILKNTKMIKEGYSDCALYICIFFGIISSIL